MNKKTIGASLVVGALVVPTAAKAGTTYAGERNADSMTWAFTQLAVDFWKARNIPTDEICPNGITARLADSLLDTDGDADGRGSKCGFWIISPAPSLLANRAYLRYRCRVVVHEVGHAYGLATNTFVSGDAVYSSYTGEWTGGEPIVVDGQYVGEWHSNHPATGVMSITNLQSDIPYPCRTIVRQMKLYRYRLPTGQYRYNIPTR